MLCVVQTANRPISHPRYWAQTVSDTFVISGKLTDNIPISCRVTGKNTFKMLISLPFVLAFLSTHSRLSG